jgi:hypothetical protein
MIAPQRHKVHKDFYKFSEKNLYKLCVFVMQSKCGALIFFAKVVKKGDIMVRFAPSSQRHD